MRVIAAQPIRPYTSPMSVVWTRGEPCSEADCNALTNAVAERTVEVIERGRWGRYNAILLWAPAANTSLYFLGELAAHQS